MSRGVGQARLFVQDEEACDLEFAFGRISLRTRRGPFKDGPNEDAAAVIPVDRETVVLAVADGVGGSPAGHEASATTMQLLEQSVSRAESKESLRGAILDAMEHANAELLARGTGSSTTLVAAEVSGHYLRCYHVGDSELIVVGQRGRIKQRIVPHSPTGLAVEAGLLGEAEAIEHEQRHLILNAVGDPGMRLEISATIAVAPRDTVLLTTDGVLDNLYFDEIVDIIRAGPLDRAADNLMAATEERMQSENDQGPSKPDDATFILYRRQKSGD